VEPAYGTCIQIARLIWRVQGLKITVLGVENLPASGGAVIAINHTGYLDFTFAGLPAYQQGLGRKVRFMAKQEVFDSKLTGPIMRSLRHIPVDRLDGAASYEAAVRNLKDGELVGVYPEATISRSFEIKAFKSGAARMAIEAGVPVVPVVIWGAHRIWTKGYPKRLGRTNTPISIMVGEPLAPDLPADQLTADLRTAMQRLLAGLQERYQHEPGAYWVPAHLGGSAPTLAEADKMDVDEAHAKAKARAERAQP
jgi:1-acyl-sn-glycerol-3-phosphate acyltransferase